MIFFYYIVFFFASQANQPRPEKENTRERGGRINNFVSLAYNKGVEEIMITQNGFDGLYMSYLYGKVRERFSFLPSACDMARHGECTAIAFKTERAYCPYVRKFTEEHIADVIAIGYKYAFFDKRLTLSLLSRMQRRVLLTALVAADYKEDRGYILRRVRGISNYCIDGLFHFRLQELQRRWEEIVECIPADMGRVATEGFLGFWAEDGEGKIFVKEGKVYDGEYRPLTRSILTGVESTLGEILLSGAEQVYCFGETEEELKEFLKKYYGEKVYFC